MKTNKQLIKEYLEKGGKVKRLASFKPTWVSSKTQRNKEWYKGNPEFGKYGTKFDKLPFEMQQRSSFIKRRQRKALTFP